MRYTDFKQGKIVECHFFKAVMLEKVKEYEATLWKGVVIEIKKLGDPNTRVGKIEEFIYDSFQECAV